MIILIPLPLFFASTVYGVAGLSGKSDDDHCPVFKLIFVIFFFFLQLGSLLE